MKLRDEDTLLFTWKVVDNRRKPGDSYYIRFVPDPDPYIDVDLFEVTAIAFERE